MRDKKLAEYMGLTQVTEATCRSCHRADAPRLRPFDYATLVKLVNHAEPPPAPAETAPTTQQ